MVGRQKKLRKELALKNSGRLCFKEIPSCRIDEEGEEHDVGARSPLPVAACGKETENEVVGVNEKKKCGSKKSGRVEMKFRLATAVVESGKEKEGEKGETLIEIRDLFR